MSTTVIFQDGTDVSYANGDFAAYRDAVISGKKGLHLPFPAEMPGLLYPGRKPTSRVKINKSHPIGEKLRFYTIITSEGIKELVGGFPHVIASGAQKIENTADGMAFIHTTGTYYYTYLNRYMPLFTTNIGIFIRIRPQFDSTTDPDVSGAETMFDTSSANSDGFRCFLLNTGKPRFRLFTSGGATNLDANETWSAGDLITFFFRYDGSTMKIYRDGIEVVSTAKTGNYYHPSSVGLFVGRSEPNLSTGLYSDVLDYGLFNDFMNDSEILSLHNNPYQFLIPE